MQDKHWNRGDKIAVASLVVAILGAIAAWLVFFVPTATPPSESKNSSNPQMPTPFSTPPAIPSATPVRLASPTCGVGQEWSESEYGYVGKWTKRPDTKNMFDARWVRDKDIEEATLNIEISGRQVFVRRTQQGQQVFNGTCAYQGTVQDDMRTVKGTYRCSWGEEVSPWTAVISCE